MVDDIDERIMELLEEDARMTYVEIGKMVGLSEGAVRNRIQSLTSTGVIKRFTIEKSTSHGVSAVTMLAVDPSTPTYEVSKSVSMLEGVERVYEVTGEYDILLVSSSSRSWLCSASGPISCTISVTTHGYHIVTGFFGRPLPHE